MPKIIKKETLRHKEAFEYYYSLGERRSLAEVGKKFGVSQVTAENWSRSFNWQERIEQRDIENAKKLAEKVNETIVESKANYRAEIKWARKIIRAAIQSALRKGADGKMHLRVGVEDIKDLGSLINAYEKLVKLDLLMMGESTDKQDLTIKVELPDDND